MKALVLTGPGQFVYIDVPTPQPEADEVLLQVKACAICGSDIHGSDGTNGRRIPPLIMGHEASGVIAQVGGAVRGWKVGDRVTFDSTQFCGTCWYCQNDLSNLCAHRRIVGVACQEYRKEGAMAEYVTVRAHTLYRLPEQVTFPQACLIEPFSVGMHAVRLSGLEPGQTAAVVGDGTIGLMTLLAAVGRGVEQVYVLGHHPLRQQTAQALGARAADGEEALLPRLRSATQGKGADVVFDTVGSQGSFAACMRAVRLGGTIVVVGNRSPEISFPLQACVVGQIKVQFSYSSQGEYPLCLEAIAQGRVDVSPFLSCFPLSQGAEIFQRLIAREEGLLKAILLP
ncbi:MAG: alcohol dehydrogenase catalytic domain-containing protein [Lawsonibacter sp.]|nr:alcohol dehydrogenase catalytic domain-containing protein [Lawsonibacter sp.]